jgi:hypothetical protein
MAIKNSASALFFYGLIQLQGRPHTYTYRRSHLHGTAAHQYHTAT